ncbi:4Fe-4S binding protein [Anaerobacterium chartisolvens]|uniref:4Fe-4S binding protein n=1 Tax=Anaerobacterium chartisolvens TaxID=1297424 RepID=UPI000DF408C0
MTSRIVLICVLIVLGAVSGKSFCGKICPFGHIQRFLYKIPFPRKVKTFKLHMMLRRIKYAILVIGLLVSIVLLLIGIPIKEPIRNTGFDWKVIVGVVIFIFICIVNYRPFCKYLCPVETILSLGNIVPIYRYNIDKQKCSHCGMCAQVCKMNLEPDKTPHHMDCNHCGACKKACRKKAITSGLNHISWRR